MSKKALSKYIILALLVVCGGGLAWRNKIIEHQASERFKWGMVYKEGSHGYPRNAAKAVEWFHKAAEQGNVSAQYTLGEMYQNGEGVSRDYSKAFAWFLRAAEQGHVQAYKQLSRMYHDGQGVEQDNTQALKWLLKAPEQGDAYYQYYVGRMYKSIQDNAQAFKWFSKAAEQNNSDAQYELGEMYRNGEGVVQDNAKAVQWFSKAAIGSDRAKKKLNFMYKNGIGVAQDDPELLAWRKKRAERHAILVKAYSKSAKYNPSEKNRLGMKYRDGEDGLIEDDTQAVYWFRKAAEEGHREAQENLGGMYERGEGVTQDYTEAMAWYRKAAEQGSGSATTKLGFIYQNGKLVAQDDAKALKLFRKVAEWDYDSRLRDSHSNALGLFGEQVQIDAQLQLSMMYLHGKGVAQDNAQAFKSIPKVAEWVYSSGLGDSDLNALGILHTQVLIDAQFQLSKMYRDGKGVAQNSASALKWLKIAEQNKKEWEQYLLSQQQYESSN